MLVTGSKRTIMGAKIGKYLLFASFFLFFFWAARQLRCRHAFRVHRHRSTLRSEPSRYNRCRATARQESELRSDDHAHTLRNVPQAPRYYVLRLASFALRFLHLGRILLKGLGSGSKPGESRVPGKGLKYLNYRLTINCLNK